MKVVMAKKAGFCMGVRRAVQLAIRASYEAEKPVYTYGPLIHNEQALKLLEMLGVKTLKEIPKKAHGTIIIRAHGVPPEDKRRLKEAGFKVLDGTCPRVAYVQALARKYSRQGYQVIIIGDPDHAEVKGILGYAGGKGLVVSSFKDLERLPPLKNYVVLSQTTQDEELFELLAQEILARYPGGKVYRTICRATHDRQREVRRLAKECDAIVVVGGKHSANTKRLALIAREEGKEVFLVETADELDLEKLKKYRKVGVTAGASTPNWVINQVVRTLEELPSPYEAAIWRVGRKVLRFLFESNLALALGAASLSGAVLWAAGFPWQWPLILMISLFLFAAHTVNRLVDLKSLRLNDPFRARFLEKNRKIFSLLTAATYLLALGISLSYGVPVFLLLLFLVFTSIVYSLPVFGRNDHFSPVQRIPGARSLFIALGWWAAMILLPAFVFSYQPVLNWLGGLVFIIAFMRAVFLELLELQGDGFVGKETLPVFLGKEKTFWVLKGMWFILGLLVLGGLVSRAFPPPYAALFLVVAYVYFVLHQYEKELLGRNFYLEVLAEGLPVITALSLLVAEGGSRLVFQR